SRETRLNERHKILVYPRVRPMPEFVMPAEQHSGDARLLASAWADYPPETSGVRDYYPGDSLGRIHWKLSTKYGRMMSKTFEQPLTSDLLIALITPSTDAGWLRNLEAIPHKRTARVAFYIDAASFGAPEPHLSFDLHSDVELFVVRKGDDFSRLMRTRNAVRLV